MRRVLFELPLLAAVAAVIVFFGCLPLKRPLDGAAFFSRSAFDRVAVLQGPTLESGGDTIVFPLFPVIRGRPDGESLAFTPELQTVEVDVVSDLAYFVDSVLGDNVRAWDGQSGAIVDEDTASRLGVDIGDSVTLHGPALGGAMAPSVPVVALSNPYTNPEDRSTTGIIVVPRAALPDGAVEEFAGVVPPGQEPYARLYDPPAGTASIGRAEVVVSFVAHLFRIDTILAVMGVFAFAGVLWVAAGIRTVGHEFGQVRHAMATLVAVGERPSRLQWAVAGVSGAILLTGQTGGTLAVVWFVYPRVLGWSLQPWVVLPVFLLMAVSSAAVISLALIRARKELGGAALLASLTLSED